MSNEYLEALKKIKQEFGCDPEYYGLGSYFEIIENGFKRLESIDNAKPNEALEKLLDGYSKGIAGRSYYDTIKQALLKAQEQEKVLEIIKEKRVNVEWFWNDFVDNGFGYHYYLEKWYKYQSTDKQKLTKEEFDLLKRWLG